MKGLHLNLMCACVIVVAVLIAYHVGTTRAKCTEHYGHGTLGKFGWVLGTPFRAIDNKLHRDNQIRRDREKNTPSYVKQQQAKLCRDCWRLHATTWKSRPGRCQPCQMDSQAQTGWRYGDK